MEKYVQIYRKTTMEFTSASAHLFSCPAFLLRSSARLFNLFKSAGDLRIVNTPISHLHILFNSSAAMKYPSSLFLMRKSKHKKANDYNSCNKMT